MPDRMTYMPDLTALQRICGLLDRGEITLAQFLSQFAARMVQDIGCSRAGVRMLIQSKEGPALRGAGLVDTTGAPVRVPDMPGLDAGPYFDTLLRDGCVVSPDCLNDPVTAGLVPEYLAPQDVRSLLDVSFSVNGVLYGTFTCEQVGETQAWGHHQLALLRQIGSRVSLTLMHNITAHIDTTPGALWEPSTPNRLMTMPMTLDGEIPDR
jgi:GAF domain-containing protein